MSTPDGPRDSGDDPFGDLPIFGDLARMLRQQLSAQSGGGQWEMARQFGVQVATEGRTEATVDPLVRMRIEELARVAELHVTTVTGLQVPTTGSGLVEAVTRTAWVTRSLNDLRPLLEQLGASLGRPAEGSPDPGDPLAMLAPLLDMMAPMMVGLSAGSMVGNLARRSFGQYDLPVPRPVDKPVLIVADNIDAFASDWSLPVDDVRLWVCVHELTHHAVLGVPHIRRRLETLLGEYAGGFDAGGGDFGARLDDLDPERLADPEALAGMLGSPDVLLGALRSPAQEAMLPSLEAIVAVVVGYVDHVIDIVGDRVLGDDGQLTEALRRRRVEATGADRFVERLLGLELTQTQYDRGRRFIDGVVERAGTDALNRLFDDERTLPTPAEVDAPGLWLARIDLPGD